MKKEFTLFFCGFIFCVIISCQSNSAKTDDTTTATATVSKPDSIDRISFVTVAMADKWKEDYHQAWKKILPKDSLPIRFFTVKTQDVLLAMGINKPWQSVTSQQYIRVNLGYDATSNQMKCFIQPVENVDLANNYAGDGMFFNKNGQIISGKGKKNTLGAKATDDDIFVADLNTPCPNTCGN
ncbi:MAG: hypothetical protein ACN4EP_10510 [Sediminibacterium sp.]